MTPLVLIKTNTTALFPFQIVCLFLRFYCVTDELCVARAYVPILTQLATVHVCDVCVCMCLWLVWFIDNNSKTERRKKQTKRAQYSKCMATHWKRHGRDDDTRSITRIVAQAYSNMLGFFGMCDRLHIYSRIYNQTPCHRTRTHTHTRENNCFSFYKLWQIKFL